MSEGYDLLAAYYVKSSDPLTPNFGLSLKGMDPILAGNFTLIDSNLGTGVTSLNTLTGAVVLAAGSNITLTPVGNTITIASSGGGGGSVNVNGSAVSNPNFNNTTPAASGTQTLVTWQVSGSSVSAQMQLAVTQAAVSHQFLTSYTSSTGVFTAAQPAFTDLSGSISASQIPSGTVVWNNIGNATGNLTLANGTNTTTFNQTSQAAAWTWANTTPATSGLQQFSPQIIFAGTIWTGSASVTDSWTIQDQTFVGPPAAAQLHISHNGLVGGMSSSVVFSDTGNLASVAFINSVAATGSNSTVSPTLILNNQYWNGSSSLTNQWNIEGTAASGTNPVSTLAFNFAAGTSGVVGVATNTNMYQYSTTTTNFLDVAAGSTGWTLNFSNTNQSTTNLSFNWNGTATMGMTAGVTNANTQLFLQGSVTTLVGASVKMGNLTNFTGGGNQHSINMLGTWAPTSGSGTFWGNLMQYTINQAGGTGSYRMLDLQVIETATVGTANRFITCESGAAGTTLRFDLSSIGTVTTYNSEATAGLGHSYLRGSTSQKSETGADANVLTVTPASAAGTYRISIVLSVSSASSAVGLGWTATWTDSNGNAQTPTNLSLFQSGTAAPALTYSTSAAGNYYGEAYVDVNNAGTNIVVKTTLTSGTIAYLASAYIERIA